MELERRPQLPDGEKLKLLFVANKKLTDRDHRVAYSSRSRVATVTFGLPDKPESLSTNEYHHFAFSEGLRPGFPLALVQLFRYLRQNDKNYDLVHYNSTLLILFGPGVARLAGIPAIITVTGFGRAFLSPKPWIRNLYLAILRVAMRSSRAVLFQNSQDLEWIRTEFDMPSGKFHLIGSGVELSSQRPRRRDSAPLTVLLVSRIMPDKGIDDFLRVAAKLQSQDYRFVLIGPASSGYHSLYQQCEEYSRRGIIEFRGEQTHEQALAAFDESDVLLFPSYGEGLSRVMIEAGYAGLCPIAYAIPSNLDLIHPGGGCLAETGDTETLAKILHELSQDRELLYRHAQNYQTHVMANYSMSAFTTRMDELLLSLSLR